MRNAIRGSFLFSIILTAVLAAAQATPGPRAPNNSQDVVKAEQANAVHTTYSGTIRLVVDASDAPRKIFHATETIPISGGSEITLVYPKWIPGEHGPTGPVADLAGLKFTAGGRTLTWRRDLTDMWAIHVELPAGTKEIEAMLDYLSPANPSGFSSGASATAQLTVVSWNQVLLYPQGTDATKVMFQPWLTIPAGWRFGTALATTSATKNGSAPQMIQFAPVALETLVDSPVITGLNFRVVDITPPGEPLHHEIDIAADSPAALEMPAETQQHYRQLIAETGALYGARHYRHYNFLLTLSDLSAHFGLEHHESSDDRVGERALLDENGRKLMGGLLPHEMTHSWNGKYRRPQDLATLNYQTPMQDDLLWVYEGLTEYLGDILAARSGLWTTDQYRENLARVAAGLEFRPGRTWRPLLDTAVDAQHLYDASQAWSSWRRGVDFYDEGELIWLEVDTIIRQQSQNKKSLDDFIHLFHGGQSGPPAVVPYAFDDVVNALNQIVPYDWRKLLTARLTSLDPHAPTGGIQNGGWMMVYNDQPNEMMAAREADGSADLSFSIGLALTREGVVVDSVLNMPAYKAGIGPGMRISAVNGRRYSPDNIRDALRVGHDSKTPLELIVENGEYFKTVRIDYRDGNRYPHLVRMANAPDLLSDIIKQHAANVK
jgi:predicted metalloprotease with PDZ domain